jgi:hypothetical protein
VEVLVSGVLGGLTFRKFWGAGAIFLAFAVSGALANLGDPSPAAVVGGLLGAHLGVVAAMVYILTAVYTGDPDTSLYDRTRGGGDATTVMTLFCVTLPLVALGCGSESRESSEKSRADPAAENYPEATGRQVRREATLGAWADVRRHRLPRGPTVESRSADAGERRS